MRQTAKQQNGFTLIELLVSMFILMMLTLVVIANFRIGEKSKRTTAAKDIVLNAVRNAQNYTLTSRQIPNNNCTVGGVEDRAATNYRVLINQSIASIILYAEDKCSNLNVVETYLLPVGTQFGSGGFSVTTTGSTATHAIVQVKFDAPFALTEHATTGGAAPSFGTYQSITVPITDTDGGNARTVLIDGISGRIE